jgi:hypothetical protein
MEAEGWPRGWEPPESDELCSVRYRRKLDRTDPKVRGYDRGDGYTARILHGVLPRFQSSESVDTENQVSRGL